MIHFTCPGCKTVMNRGDHEAGIKIACSGCGQRVQVPPPLPPSSHVSSNQAGSWFFSHDGQRLGPISLAQLKHLASSGQLQAADLVWQESMSNWVPASAIPELTALVSSTRLRLLWTVLLCTGAGLLLLAFFTPWWGMHLRKPERSSSGSGERYAKDMRTLERIRRESKSWYLDNIGARKLEKYEDRANELRESEEVSLWLWGWSTGAGIVGLLLSVAILPMVLAPIFLKFLRPWSWIASFGSAVLGLIILILSLVWLFGSPGESVPDTFSQGVIIGPYLVLLAGLLLLLAGIVDGLKGLLLFLARIKLKAA